jgi:hypothetical protein
MVLIRWTWSLALVVAAVIAFLGAIPTASTFNPGLFLLAAALLIASVMASLRAIAAGSGIPAGGKRAVLLSSITSLMMVFAGVVLVVGLNVVATTPTCQENADVCVFSYGVEFFAVEAILVVVAVIAAIVAMSVALASASKAGQRGWFRSLLVYLIGSLLIAVGMFVALSQSVTSDVNLQGNLVMVALALLLALPVLTLLYSLSSGEGRKRT